MHHKKIISLLSSLRFFIAVLTLCGLVSLIGIVIPQNAAYEAYADRFGAAGAQAIAAFGWDRIFTSPWFIIPLAALCVNLIVCLGTRFFSLVQTLQRNKNGRADACGSFLLHAGILMVLAGAVVQYRGNDKEEIVVAEGAGMRIDRFRIDLQLRDFSIVRNARGEAVNYRSTLDILNLDDSAAVTAVSMVNRPLSFHGLSFHQMTFGRIPDAVRDFHAVVADTAGDTIFNGTIPYKTVFPLGNNGLSLQCTDFSCDFFYDFENGTVAARSPEHGNPAFKVTLFRNGAPVDAQWLLQRFPLINSRIGPYILAIPSYTPLYYSGILVQKKPGTPYILTGLIAASVGLAVTLLSGFRRQSDHG